MRARTLLALVLLPLAACGKPDREPDRGEPKREPGRVEPKRQPDHVVVDHILIGVRSGNFPGRFEGKRPEAEARKFAYDLLAKLEAGGDWAAAKRDHSEDPPPGRPYAIANDGVAPLEPDEYQRSGPRGMAPAFGDVGFVLDVGEIGIADYDAKKSPFGFHIIKRVK
jgi:hypothetical protein